MSHRSWHPPRSSLWSDHSKYHAAKWLAASEGTKMGFGAIFRCQTALQRKRPPRFQSLPPCRRATVQWIGGRAEDTDPATGRLPWPVPPSLDHAPKPTVVPYPSPTLLCRSPSLPLGVFASSREPRPRFVASPPPRATVGSNQDLIPRWRHPQPSPWGRTTVQSLWPTG